MKLGAMSTCIMHRSFDDGLAFLRGLGAATIEVGCGGFEPAFHEEPQTLLESEKAFQRWRDTFTRHELEISAFAIHGEPLSPDAATARLYDDQFRQACLLAEKCGVTRLTLLAGIPEGSPGDKSPCWITGAFPADNLRRLEWQWEERVIPYWTEHAKIADEYGCILCFEMIENDVVHNPITMRRLHEAIGPTVMCNFDPSHLFCQGIDPLLAIDSLGDLIAHVHAKDTKINTDRARLVGLLDTAPHSELNRRAWSFRTVGYGHDALFWADFVTALRAAGYDDVVSIEHEDGYVQLDEGVEKAFRLLRGLIFEHDTGDRWIGYEHTQMSAATQ